MPNSSNPTLSITSANVGADRANLDMEIQNSSDMDIRVEEVDWTLVYGPLPAADGTWRLDVPLPSGGTYRFSKQVAFTTPPLDRSADEVELSGELHVTTEGNDGETALQGAGFVSKAKVRN